VLDIPEFPIHGLMILCDEDFIKARGYFGRRDKFYNAPRTFFRAFEFQTWEYLLLSVIAQTRGGYKVKLLDESVKGLTGCLMGGYCNTHSRLAGTGQAQEGRLICGGVSGEEQCCPVMGESAPSEGQAARRAVHRHVPAGVP
jgi:hypothetical protein